MIKQGEYSTYENPELIYDRGLDGVWISDVIFLPRSVVIKAISLIAENEE